MFRVLIFMCMFFLQLVFKSHASEVVAQTLPPTQLEEEQLAQAEQEQLEKVEKVEAVVDHIYDLVEDRVSDPEMKDRLDEKKEEIEELLEQTSEDIEDASSEEDMKEAIEEAKEAIYLKTYSGLTDHDSVEEFVQVEGGRTAQKRAQETALDAIKDEGGDTYTIMLKAKLTMDQVRKRLGRFDEDLELGYLFDEDGVSFFELLLEEGSKLSDELLADVEDGEIPDHMLGISVIKPEVYEIGAIQDIQVAGHAGEKTTKLRGMEAYESVAYQGGLQQKEKISVGIVDTGIDYTHPDLKENISTRIAGYDFVNKDTDPMDDHMHGTHVAGTVGGSLNGNGVYGVNTNVELVALKICNKYGYCPSYAIYNAVKYAADTGIQVLNMSLGGKGSTKNNTTCQAIEYAIKKGVIVIVAAGNANRPVSQYIPGACSQAITVGAVDENLTRASFSNYGPLVDVSAPGVGVYSTIPGGKYASLDGTSMATPHISGLVSAMLSYDSSLNQAQIRTKLLKATRDISYQGVKVLGGFVRMPKVMTALGAQKYSHTYTLAGGEGLLQDEGVSIQSLDDDGMQLNTTYLKLRVGQKKQLVISDAKNTISVVQENSNGHMALAIGSLEGASEQSMSIQSNQSAGIAEEEVEDQEKTTSEIELFDLDGRSVESHAFPTDQEIAEFIQSLSSSSVSGEDLEVDESMQDDAEAVEAGTMIASSQSVGVIDVLGTKPGKTWLHVTDQTGKKIKVVVEVLPKTVAVTLGRTKKVKLPSWALARKRGQNYVYQKKAAYHVAPGADGSSFLLQPKQLGTYAVELPILNTHGHRKRINHRQMLLHIDLKVISPRIDLQANRQAEDTSFWMSADYAKLKVGQKIDINLEGEGPFKIMRKTGGIVGYANKQGGGLKIASVEDVGGQETLDFDLAKEGMTSEDELANILSGVIILESNELELDVNESASEDDSGVLLSQQQELWADQDESNIQIASVGGGQSFSLVGLVPGDEIVYVTDKNGHTKNILVQVQETHIHVPPGKRNVSEMYLYPDLTRSRLAGVSVSDWRDRNEVELRSKHVKGYDIPQSPADMKYDKFDAYQVRGVGDLPSIALDVYVDNLVEGPKRENRYRRAYQKMQYILDFTQSPQTSKPVRALSKISQSFTKVPDAFKLSGTINMTVGDMKTVMVGSAGGKYSYRKTNNNIGWIANKEQDVKVASAGDSTEQEGELLLDIPHEDETDQEEDQVIDVPADLEMVEPLSPEQEQSIASIDDTSSDDSSDISYEEIETEDDNVAIASVNGKPVTFVALRPGVSYVKVKYANGTIEKVKLVISAKKISKEYRSTLDLTSTRNLVVRKIWAKSKNKLEFVKKPKKWWKGGVWSISASSLKSSDVVFAQVYSRKEKKNLYLQLNVSVQDPEPISLSKKSVTLRVGQTFSLGVNGGGKKLSVRKANHKFGFIANAKKGVAIASASDEGEQDKNAGDEVFDEDLEMEIVQIVDEADESFLGELIEEDEYILSNEQLLEGEIEGVDEETRGDDKAFIDTESSDISGDMGDADGLEVASAKNKTSWRRNIRLQAFRPGTSYVHIQDETGQKESIKLIIKPSVKEKQRGEILSFTSSFQLPVRSIKTATGDSLDIVEKPEKRWKGGVWEIDTTELASQILYARVYSKREKRYMRLELSLDIIDAPLTVSTQNIEIGLAGYIGFTIDGGVQPYSFSFKDETLAVLDYKPGSFEKDHKKYVFGLSSGTTHFSVKDATGASKKILVKVLKDEKNITIGEDLKFTGWGGLRVSGVSSEKGQALDIKSSGLTKIVDSSRLEKDDVLLVKYNDDLSKKKRSLVVRYPLSVTEYVPVGPTGAVYCSKQNELCILPGPAKLMYGDVGKYVTRSLGSGSHTCSDALFPDVASLNVERKACWYVLDKGGLPSEQANQNNMQDPGGSQASANIVLPSNRIKLGTFFEVAIEGGSETDRLVFDSEYVGCTEREDVGIIVASDGGKLDSHNLHREGDQSLFVDQDEGEGSVEIQSNASRVVYDCLAYKAGNFNFSLETDGVGIASDTYGVQVYKKVLTYTLDTYVRGGMPLAIETTLMKSNKPECFEVYISEKNYIDWRARKICGGVVVKRTGKHNGKRFDLELDMEGKGIPEISQDYLNQLFNTASQMEILKTEANVIKATGSNLEYIQKKKAILDYLSDHVRTDGPWDYKNTAWYAGYKEVTIFDAEYPIDVTGNFAFGYTAMAGGIPFVIQGIGSTRAQIKLDISKSDSDNTLYNPLDTIINEISDLNAVFRGALLYKHYGKQIDGGLLTSYLQDDIDVLSVESVGEDFYFVQ